MHIRVKGFQIFKDRHGKQRCYHRATRTAIDLSKHPIGSVGFIAECERIRAKSEAIPKPRPGTLSLLFRKYLKSAHFKSRSSKTQQSYNAVIDYLQPIGDTPLAIINPPFIAKLRDKAGLRGYAAGNDVKRTLSAGASNTDTLRRTRARVSEQFLDRRIVHLQTARGPIRSVGQS